MCVFKFSGQHSAVKRKTRFLSLYWAALLLAVGFVATSFAVEELPDPENDKNTYRIKIRRLQHGIIEQKKQVSSIEQRERNILAEIEELDRKILAQTEKLARFNKKKIKQQKLIQQKEEALAAIHEEKKKLQQHLQNRMAAYYTLGDIGLFNVLFSSNSFPDVLSFRDSFESLIEYDQTVITRYRNTIIELERIKSALTLEKVVLEDFIAQAEKQTALHNKIKSEKKSLLAYVRSQSDLHKQAIVEMQEAAAQFEEAIAAIKQEDELRNRAFLVNRGNLPPPVDGILVGRFNEEKTNKLGISRTSRGIELQAYDGTEIIAVGDGNVIYSGYLRGYGNTVIIYHGFQYYTITSRIEKLLVQAGDKVKIGQPIGVVGDSATLFDEGLYFEIRRGKIPEDPLLWLDPNRLSPYYDLIY